MGVTTDLIAGTVSGMVASLAGQPLDTIRVRVQSRGHFYTSSWDTLTKTMRANGVRGFFRGTVPPLLGKAMALSVIRCFRSSSPDAREALENRLATQLTLTGMAEI